MHIVAHVTQHYNHESVPADFDMKSAEFATALKDGRVKPAARGGFLVRVTRKVETHVHGAIPENEIMQRILHHALPQNGSQVMSRKEAAADYFTVRQLPSHALPTWVTRFEVHDDHKPDEAEFRAFLAPYVATTHAQTGDPIVPGEMVEPLVRAYLEESDALALQTHLHSRFKLPPPVATREVQS